MEFIAGQRRIFPATIMVILGICIGIYPIRTVLAQTTSSPKPQTAKIAFLVGDPLASLQLADAAIENARSQPNFSALADGLIWRGLALITLEKDDQVDAAWSEAAQVTKSHNLIPIHIEVLGLQSLWAQRNNPYQAYILWDAAMKTAESITNSVDALTGGRILNCLGMVQQRRGLAGARAFSIAQSLMEKSAASPIDLAAVSYNLGCEKLRSADLGTTLDIVSGALDEAKTNLNRALGIFQTVTKNQLGLASCSLQLSWVASGQGETESAEHWKAQFLDLMKNLPESDLRQLRDSEHGLLTVPQNGGDGVSRGLQSGAAAFGKNLDGVSQSFSYREFFGKDGATNFLPRSQSTQPIKSFVMVWGQTEGWSRGRLPLKPIPAEVRHQSVQQFRASDTNILALQEQAAAARMSAGVMERMASIRDMMNMRRTNPAAFQVAIQSQMGAVGQSQKITLTNGVIALLPGEVTFVPDPWMAMGNPAATILEDASALEFEKPLSQQLQIRVASVNLARSERGLNLVKRTGMVGVQDIMAGGFDYPLVAALADADEPRAAWQVREDAHALSKLRDDRLKNFLALPEHAQLKAELNGKQAQSITAFLNFIQQSDAATHASPGELPAKSEETWSQSTIYDQAISEIDTDITAHLPAIMDTSNASQSLPDGAIYISYGDQRASKANYYVLLMDGRKDRTHPEILVKRFAFPVGLALLFRQAVENQGSNLEDVTALGRKLFSRLFPGEIGDRLREAHRVIISPPDNYWSFPFGALVMNTAGAPQFLGLEKDLSYTESVALLKACRAPRSERPFKPDEVLALGASNFNRPDQQAIFNRFYEKELPELPESANEARQVASVYQASPLLGDEATESAVRARIENAAIIHFASHGYAGLTKDVGRLMSLVLNDLVHAGSWTGMPGIWLTVKPTSSAHDFAGDGLLQSWEVKSQFQLQADLVVLSACDTGDAKAYMAHGPELPLAFLYAGARSVVAAQMPVNDQSTAALMPDFHRLIRQGLAKDEALRTALAHLQAKADFSHPAFWAPFILVGDPDNQLFTKK